MFASTLLLAMAAPAAHAASNLQVNLGYATYQGSLNDYGLNSWIGMRYAAAPIGDNRWRAPQAPPNQGSTPIMANSAGSRCPQVYQAASTPSPVFGGSEDCLFLNVVAPPNANNLPVLVYIHGGGYGSGSAGYNFSEYANLTNNGFVGVDIQYRLGAFGFLASTEVHNDGKLNAGLLDQHFALQWINSYITKFGGNPQNVILIGQSAGGGSILNQAMAYGGSDGSKYFHAGISASPYTPEQFNYSDARPEYYYSTFASMAGCGKPSSGTRLQCLRAADTNTLMTANTNSSGNTTIFGTWAFTPIQDGDFLRQLPSAQLTSGKTNGKIILTGHNADEGPQFVAPNITTAADFNAFLRYEYPLLTQNDIDQINNVYYPYKNETPYNFATCGDCGAGAPNAINTGSYAIGHQQRAVNVYSELTIVCPSYWLADGFDSSLDSTKKAFKYQFSVPPASHGMDNNADGINSFANNPFDGNIGADFHTAMVQMFANLITKGDPSITNQQANGASSSNPSASNPASSWPQWHQSGTQMMDLNETSTQVTGFYGIGGYKNPPAPVGKYATNKITLTNGTTFEAGRGKRCDFWKSINARART